MQSYTRVSLTGCDECLSTEQIFLLARENLRPPKRFKTPPLGAEVTVGDGSRAPPWGFNTLYCLFNIYKIRLNHLLCYSEIKAVSSRHCELKRSNPDFKIKMSLVNTGLLRFSSQ